MTVDELTVIGVQLYGSRWKAKMARALARSPATVFNWVAGRIDVPETAARRIRQLAEQHERGRP
jgi:DNA-binding transcriptional regulator YdaS (Cro superfamily)